ncbi:hypothetical protein PORY_002236 [Pneumocystis oryctolagi]|uniref:Uncharacterized protein n=1 Tax=Pneumocystis oryctolagi TaxID=42067 RepID=A0ACB7C999_9ASCO|nr:hypothetical protein PORY_002236 [Pneumocystis oryctolagi]
MTSSFSSFQRILICSIGNPGKTYRFTRHNLGHYVLDQIRNLLGFSVFKEHPLDLGSYAYHERFPFVVLYQSGVFMNESGKAVRRAWTRFCTDSLVYHLGEKPLLVIFHDDIEEKFGVVKVREQGKSRGHKGIRSCIEFLLTESFIRVSIGLGRPSEKSKNVADFVLQKFSPQELNYIHQKTIPEVIQTFEKLTRLKINKKNSE